MMRSRPSLMAMPIPWKPTRCRIIVPDALLAGAGISRGENVAFLGLGSRFQLWEPEAVAAQKAAALAVNAARLALRKATVP